MLNNCDCGRTCGCEKCNPDLHTNLDWYTIKELIKPIYDYTGDLIVPESSKWRQGIENELRARNNKSGFPVDYGYFIRK